MNHATPRANRTFAAPALLALSALLALPPRLAAATNSWSPIGPAGATVTALAVSPASSSTIVAGTTTGYSVTRNGGSTWSAVSTGYETLVIAFDPSNASIVYAGTGALSAEAPTRAPTYVPVLLESTLSLAIDPSSPATLYAGTVDHIYKSTDRGLTWAVVYTGPGHSFVNALAVDPGNSQVVWAAMTFGGVKKSTNGGTTWTTVSGSVPMGPAPSSVVAIAVHPTSSNTVLMLGMDGVYRTTDGGTNWSQVTRLHSLDGDLVADRAAPGTFYASGSDGVAFSADGGATWNHLDSGLTNTNVQGPRDRPGRHTRIYAGTAGAGVFSMTVDSGGAPTLRVTSPNGGEVWQAGLVHPITWTASGAIANVKIEYSTTSPWDGQLVDPEVDRGEHPEHRCVLLDRPVCDVEGLPRSRERRGGIDLGHQRRRLRDHELRLHRALPPFSQSFGPAGGRGTIQVTPSMGCSWSAASDDSWIVVTSGWSGTGSGSLTYSVAPNLDSSPRSGTLRIGSTSFSVEQSGGTPSTEGVVFVPIVLDVFGVAPSHYTSELTLTNRSDRDASVRLTYTGAATLGGGSGTAQVTLPARRQIVEPDALAFLARLGAPIPASGNRGGTLAVGVSGVPSLSDVAATVRTTTAVANGQAGLAYGGTPAWKALDGNGVRLRAPRERDRPLERGAPERRHPAEGESRFASPSARAIRPPAIVRPDVTLPPGGFLQIGGILGEHGMTNGYVKVERVGGTAPYYAYGVVNDQANSDGSFIPPQLATTAPVSGPDGPRRHRGGRLHERARRDELVDPRPDADPALRLRSGGPPSAHGFRLALARSRAGR